MTYTRHVRIVEVGPRDGLQNEPGVLSVDTKVALIEALEAAGARTIEVGSFVSPRWVPQMADTAEVIARLRPAPRTTRQALVPNLKGFAAAAASGVDEVAVFAAASEAFSQKNINCSIDESLRRFEPVLAAARDRGIPVRGYVSCVLGSPYGDTVTPGMVLDVARRLHDLGCYEVSLGDTIGRGTPLMAQRMVEHVLRAIPVERVALHFHDTYGQALANILACLSLGVSTIDAAMGGLGGCPYAPGASGNVATEDLVYMLHGMDIETGLELDRVVDIAISTFASLGRLPNSRLAQAYAATRVPLAGEPSGRLSAARCMGARTTPGRQVAALHAKAQDLGRLPDSNNPDSLPTGVA